jgi:hypothetical protein
MRVVFESFCIERENSGLLADDGVCCEPLSMSNSLIIRENTGNFVILSLDPMDGGAKRTEPA